VVLNQPQLRIVTLKNGVDSFSGLADQQEGSEQQPSEVSDVTPDSSQDTAFIIEGLQINDALVVMDDQEQETGGGLADVSVSGVVQDSSQPDEIEFSLTTLAQINIETLDILLADVTLNAELADNVVVATIADLSYAQSQIIEINDISAQWSGAQKAQVNTNSVLIDLNQKIVNIPSIDLSSGGMNAVLSNVLATNIIDAPSIVGNVDVVPFDARALMRDMQIDFEPSDAGVLKRVAIKTNFNATTESVSMSNLLLNLDQSTLSGSSKIVNFDEPQIAFDLKLDQLNLDNYLPESEAEAPANVTTVEKADAAPAFDPEALKVPMDVFRQVNANGNFAAQKLISDGLEFNDIDVTIKSSEGNVVITPKANLYDGKTDGVLSFSERDGVSKLKIDNQIDLVSLGEMLTQADITDQLSGIGSLIVDMVVTEKNGIQSNEGTIKLVAKNGALKGVDIQNIIQSGYSKYRDFKGRSLTEEETTELSGSSDETKFAELLGTFHVKNYRITNDDFSLKAPLFRVSGAGDILIDSQTLDYTVNFSVVDTLKGQGGDAFESLSGLTIPIRLSGALTAPSYSVDWNGLYKSLAKQRVEEEKAKLVKEKLGLDVGEDLSTKNVLKQLLIKQINKDKAETAAESIDNTVQTEQQTDPEQSKEAEEPKSTKDQLKDELKNKLLESLFN